VNKKQFDRIDKIIKIKSKAQGKMLKKKQQRFIPFLENLFQCVILALRSSPCHAVTPAGREKPESIAFIRLTISSIRKDF